jgi:hypothetical protein
VSVIEILSDESHPFRFDKHASALHFDLISVGSREEPSIHDCAISQNQYTGGIIIRRRAQFRAPTLSDTESLHQPGEKHRKKYAAPIHEQFVSKANQLGSWADSTQECAH